MQKETIGKEAARVETHQTQACRNCGHENVEAFCAACGQEVAHHILPLRDLVGEMLDAFLTFDSRLFATLKPLLIRPGFLTCAYLRGRRAAFIAPLRLYFMMSALHFFVFSFYAQPQMQKMFATSSPEFAAFAPASSAAPLPVKSSALSDADANANAKAVKKARLMKKLQTRLNAFWAVVFRAFIHLDAFFPSGLCGRDGCFVSAAKTALYGASDFYVPCAFV